MKIQLRRRNARSLHTLHLETEATIGSAPANPIVLVDPMIAATHARIWVEHGRLYVEDLGSATGTWVDGYRIRNATRMYRSMVVGAYEFSPLQPDLETVLVERMDTGERREHTGPLPGLLPWTGHLDGAPCRVFRPELGTERERHLVVSIEPPEARVIEPVAAKEYQITAQQRVSLLFYLARAAEQDRVSGAGGGWRSPEEVAVAIWGREGRQHARKKLSTITYRVRTELENAGLGKDLIERSSTGLRLVASSVELR